jgi:hypothetical protein
MFQCYSKEQEEREINKRCKKVLAANIGLGCGCSNEMVLLLFVTRSNYCACVKGSGNDTYEDFAYNERF